jgi:phosphopantetheinyl transferase
MMLAADSIDALRQALETGRSPGGAMRLALFDPTAERRALANKVLDRGKPWLGNKDIWFSPSALGGKLAFLFPGVEAQFALHLDDAPDAIRAAAESADVEIRGTGVFALGRLLVDLLGVAPDAIAGHSMGEWTGMVASEMIPPAAVDEFLAGIPAGSLEVPDVVFAAVGCSADGSRAALDGLDHISISHDNCPHQSILCGRRDRVLVAIERLGNRGVLCQELPFRSGFHSPLFADYLAPHRARLQTLALQRPRVPLWSATICAPYPDQADAIRTLAVDHLVKPVRFRELVENMYASGIRAFVQLGVGSLVGFVDDTLRGVDHLAISAASQHPGQLDRTRCALWACGFASGATGTAESRRAARSAMPLPLGVPLVRLGDRVSPLGASAPRVETGGDPILAELVATLDEAAAASRAVVDAYRARSRPQQLVIKRKLSIETVPALIDHCFYRQPEGWPSVSDRYPVVPMTANIQMMIETAAQLVPDRIAVAIENVRAYRWLAVAPQVEVELHAKKSGDDVDVEIPGYARGTVVFAERFSQLAATLPPLENPHATPVTARRMYDERWMFHGPKYQGVVELGPMGDNGVDGVIDALPAPGALLDCAGQLMGWWVMQTETRDRLAMPIEIDRISFLGPQPTGRVGCHVRIAEVADREVRADLELFAGARLWCRIDGWKDRRFDSDDAVWNVLMYPERNVLAEDRGDYVVVTEHWRAAASRELMMRRYLGERERAVYEATGPRGRRGWLLGRIAIKDAVRLHRWRAGEGPIFPIEVEVSNHASGRPLTNSNHRVSVAHKEDIAVAIVGTTDVGIDIERIEPRTEAFVAVAFTPAERALAMDDAWIARLWAAKEAVAKARGTGITDPKRFEVRSIDGERVIIDDRIVETRRDGEHVIAWTK